MKRMIQGRVQRVQQGQERIDFRLRAPSASSRTCLGGKAGRMRERSPLLMSTAMATTTSILMSSRR
ncbi:hypothetical protein V2J09_010378 [Rumex salicifolius]